MNGRALRRAFEAVFEPCVDAQCPAINIAHCHEVPGQPATCLGCLGWGHRSLPSGGTAFCSECEGKGYVEVSE